ncbi:hypothetical protein BDZ45DRAFT_675831 [Acephala macrosclerotiorum]|nr:hypothetical protein BDZ45DRAFT_675831 [Acephala macrosclerotiorum]
MPAPGKAVPSEVLGGLRMLAACAIPGGRVSSEPVRSLPLISGLELEWRQWDWDNGTKERGRQGQRGQVRAASQSGDGIDQLECVQASQRAPFSMFEPPE